MRTEHAGLVLRSGAAFVLTLLVLSLLALMGCATAPCQPVPCTPVTVTVLVPCPAPRQVTPLVLPSLPLGASPDVTVATLWSALAAALAAVEERDAALADVRPAPPPVAATSQASGSQNAPEPD